MGRKLTASFEDLIRSRYGMRGDSPEQSRFALNIDELLAGYYGAPPKRNCQKSQATSIVLSCRHDDGEVVPQRRATGPEYVAQQQSVDDSSQAEYVARELVNRSRSSPDDVSATLECQIDLGEPLAGSPAAEPLKSARPEPSPFAGAPLRPSVPPSDATSGAKSLDDDFMADMQSILSGQKVFDPVQKKTIDKSDVQPQQSAANGDLPAPDAKNSQAIFDRIAQSMEHANTYNLGTIELANRFAEFDALEDLRGKPKRAERAPGSTAAPAQPVSSEDFISDLDEIRTRQERAKTPAPPVAASSQQSVRGSYSRPFFDTGEHVRMGGDLYGDGLRVGNNPGVPFSYGQIIAMADLYESVDQMMNADVSELGRLKTLIEQSTAHYTTGGPDVSTKDWQDATGGRYLKLAADNYEHFSPVAVTGLGARGSHGDNRSAWERHHQRAIEEAQKAQLGQNASVFLEYPLIINAFGDHYLTDAFASGHLINKEATIDRFKSKFLKSGQLTSGGKKFFENVAKKAFRGDVAKKFSVLETADYPICAYGWCFMWHPNVDTAHMFTELLTHAAEEQPDKVANFAVKAFHDHLNRNGIEVVNDNGDPPWLLKGDVHLDSTTLAIARRAVQQSVDNVNDPSILASNLNFDPFFAKVWKYVPKPTDRSKQTIASLMNAYTTPDSGVLVDAAATVIHDEVDGLIQTLLDEGKLKAA
jgi:hypothetical protein